MIPDLPSQACPDWLANVDERHLPIDRVLDGSLYYPASGVDGDPVQYLGGYVHSFVYVDYGLGRACVIEALNARPSPFAGYTMCFLRDVSEQELCPDGWRPVELPTAADGNPAYRQGCIKEPFALWAVFKRNEDRDPAHGPATFSLLYVGADGSAAFQAMYYSHKVRPKVATIIQPGTGFGGNWTEFRDENSLLGRSILKNPAGRPDAILYGMMASIEPRCCWPSYTSCVHQWRSNNHQLGLWFP